MEQRAFDWWQSREASCEQWPLRDGIRGGVQVYVLGEETEQSVRAGGREGQRKTEARARSTVNVGQQVLHPEGACCGGRAQKTTRGPHTRPWDPGLLPSTHLPALLSCTWPVPRGASALPLRVGSRAGWSSSRCPAVPLECST